MKNYALPELTHEMLAQIQHLIALGQHLKTAPETKSFSENFRIARIIQEADYMQFPIDHKLAKLLAQENPVSKAEMASIVSNASNPSQTTTLPIIFFVAVCYLHPCPLAFGLTDHIIEKNDDLSIEGKTLIKSLLYPILLCIHSPTAMTMLGSEAIIAALHKLQFNFSKEEMLISMLGINWILGDSAPSKLLGTWYEQALATCGPFLYAPIGFVTACYRHRHMLFQAKAHGFQNKTAEDTCDDFENYPEVYKTNAAPQQR